MNPFASDSAKTSSRTGTISVLDIGSSKICCIIARLKPCGDGQMLHGRTHKPQVIGIGHQRARGIKSGVVIDLEKAEQAIRLAVDAAERMAGVTIDSLVVNISAGRQQSGVVSAEVDLGGHSVDRADIKRVLSAGARQVMAAERQIVHALPNGYVLDGERGIKDPMGMVGDRLGLDIHVLTADSAPIRNLELCVNRCHLSVEAMVAGGYASGLSTLVEDEMEMGAACIDIGGGTTSIAIFHEGSFVYAASVPVGGNHVTMDLARGLSTRLDEAERLKVMFGSALNSATDDHDLVNVAPIGDDPNDPGQQIPRTIMTRIVRARVEETLEMVRDKLVKSGYSNVFGRRIVLTGGGSQLPGLPETARRILARSVRLGRPLGVAGLPEAAKGPSFATAVGLMVYPQIAGSESAIFKSQYGRRGGATGRIARVGQWLRDSF
jgi:cell division protein FtsA